MIRHLPATPADFVAAFEEVRTRLLAQVDDLDAGQLDVPYAPEVNPFGWELAHVAWFVERWTLRNLAGRPPLAPGKDALYDSAEAAHRDRWRPEFRDVQAARGYLERVFAGVREELEGLETPGEDALYFLRLALFHTDMHVEAFVMMRHYLGLPAPVWAVLEDGAAEVERAPGGDAEFEGGALRLGARRDAPFVFDNEQWAHPVEVRPFRLARTPVTQAEMRAFAEDGGYRRPGWWSAAGWAWRMGSGAEHPLHWRPDGAGGWERRAFDVWVPLEDDLPVHHVNAHEAEAWCRWARRRLPTEAELELAWGAAPFPWGPEPVGPERANLDLERAGPVAVGALGAGDGPGGTRQLAGNVWEWTASPFGPYPGFESGPYREYSTPWFRDHRVARGGSFATRSRYLRRTYRNFYLTERRDPFIGFRSAADAD